MIGAVLIPGASAPKLVRREMIAGMKRGAVMVDVAIDQGGCFETSHATTHTDPVYFVDDVLHYCVSNMPAAVPHTSTFGLTNATFPYLLELANSGLEEACEVSPAIREGVNTYNGYVTHAGRGGIAGAGVAPAGSGGVSFRHDSSAADSPHRGRPVLPIHRAPVRARRRWDLTFVRWTKRVFSARTSSSSFSRSA